MVDSNVSLVFMPAETPCILSSALTTWTQLDTIAPIQQALSHTTLLP